MDILRKNRIVDYDNTENRQIGILRTKYNIELGLDKRNQYDICFSSIVQFKWKEDELTWYHHIISGLRVYSLFDDALFPCFSTPPNTGLLII